MERTFPKEMEREGNYHPQHRLGSCCIAGCNLHSAIESSSEELKMQVKTCGKVFHHVQAAGEQSAGAAYLQTKWHFSTLRRGYAFPPHLNF